MTNPVWRTGAAVQGTNTSLSTDLVIPGTVQAGDLLVLGFVLGDATGTETIKDPTGVTGWTAFGPQQLLSGAVAKAWWKVASAADAGATVTCSETSTGTPQNEVILGVWSGGDNAAPMAVISAAAADSTSSVSHVMPTVNTTGKGSTLIASLYMGRGPADSTTATASDGWTVQEKILGTHIPGINAVIIDSGSVQAEGSALGGGTITNDSAGNYNFAWTFAIAPSVAVQTARPIVDVTTTGWTPSVTLGGGVQECTLVADSSDGTYLTSQAAPSAQVWEAKLPAMSAAPNTVTNRIYFTGGAVSGTVVTALVQGTTVIASRTDTWASSPPTTPTDLVLTLTGPQQASITNLSDLRIRCTVTAS